MLDDPPGKVEGFVLRLRRLSSGDHLCPADVEFPPVPVLNEQPADDPTEIVAGVPFCGGDRDFQHPDILFRAQNRFRLVVEGRGDNDFQKGLGQLFSRFPVNGPVQRDNAPEGRHGVRFHGLSVGGRQIAVRRSRAAGICMFHDDDGRLFEV